MEPKNINKTSENDRMYEMKQEKALKIKSKYVGKFKNGYPLIFKEAIMNVEDVQTEGQIVRLVDENNQFLARGFYGEQNKGLGWIISNSESEQIDQAFFNKRIEEAIKKRKGFYRNQETTAFRVFNGEGDGIGGLTIDYFNEYYLINWYSEGVYCFKDFVIHALNNTVNAKGIYQKKRFASKGEYIEEDDFVSGERASLPLIVKENGVKFAIYLNEGAMVGVFLDQRDVRRTLRDKYAKGKTVLNTFSYTGAFSVFAAMGGATKTTSIDLANRSLSKTIEQFSINDIDYEAQDIIVDDVFKYFKYAKKKGLSFDVVVLDPPCFARSKKFTFSAKKDYKDLLKEAIDITERNGTIIASTNCSNFELKKFKESIDTAFKEMKSKYEIVEQFSLPEDFRTNKQFKEGDYLKVFFVRKLK